nr:hypothetical protein [Prevotella sp.]
MDMKKKLLLSMILLALCQMVTASLHDLNQSDSVENIAGEGGEGGEDGPIHDNNDIIWND